MSFAFVSLCLRLGFDCYSLIVIGNGCLCEIQKGLQSCSELHYIPDFVHLDLYMSWS